MGTPFVTELRTELRDLADRIEAHFASDNDHAATLVTAPEDVEVVIDDPTAPGLPAVAPPAVGQALPEPVPAGTVVEEPPDTSGL